jgi:vacuolar-type H+-ATPase subunit F/Vma7
VPAPIFIGDEVSAAGFRLAGARVEVPAPGAETTTLRDALRDRELVLITVEVARAIDPAVLRPLLAAPHPLLMLVPDVRGAVPLPNLGAQVRAELGLGA